MPLEEYRRKRRFDRTPEPTGQSVAKPQPQEAPRRFFIQKHNARNLHYDLRLEMDGVLKSWAVPKGPSLDPTDKRLAVHVEDHPLEYGDFEGVIPEGEYGAGAVIVWDTGTWYPLTEDGYESGDLKFVLEGEKLRGRWMLVHTGRRRGDPKHWLWFKERDEETRAAHEFNVLKAEPRSVISGRSIEEIEALPPAVWRTQAGVREVTGTGASPALPDELQAAAVKQVAGARVVAMPRQLAPLLPTTTRLVPRDDEWLHEIKYDGYRMLAFKEQGRVRLISRNGLDWTHKAPKLAAEIACLPITEGILDGEIVVHAEDGTTSFQMLQNRIRKGDDQELHYYFFDLLYVEGCDLQNSAIEDRKSLLDLLLASVALPSIHYSQHIVGDGLTVLEHARAMGVEGIVSKKIGSRYHEGRSQVWLKKKFLETDEFTVIGYTTSEAQPFGALLVASGDPLEYQGRVGTGFTAQTLTTLANALQVRATERCPLANLPAKERGREVRWVRPELMVELEFAGLTGDGLLRFPSFRGVREAEPEPGRGDGARQLTLDAAVLADLPTEKLASLKLTHPHRIMYPELGTTKLDLVTYYAQTAARVLPHLRHRPLSLFRCPEGVEGTGFFQKQPPQGLPDSVEQVELTDADGSVRRVMSIEDAAGLLALVQFSVLEFHIGGSRLDRLDRPDQIVLDLDPDVALDWETVLAASVQVRELLKSLGLVSFVKMSGGKGLHVVVPIRRRNSWDEVFEFSKGIAKRLARDHLDRFVATVSKRARQGKIYLDYLRNKPTATAIAPLSTRARSTGAIAMPVSWEELAGLTAPDQWTVANVAARIATDETDAWYDFFDVDQTITKKMLLKL